MKCKVSIMIVPSCLHRGVGPGGDAYDGLKEDIDF